MHPWQEWKNIFNTGGPTTDGVYTAKRQQAVITFGTAAEKAAARQNFPAIVELYNQGSGIERIVWQKILRIFSPHTGRLVSPRVVCCAYGAACRPGRLQGD